MLSNGNESVAAHEKPVARGSDSLNDTLPSDGGPAKILNSGIAVGICSLLAFGPLAFGASEAWAILILQAGVALILIAWAIGAIAYRVDIRTSPLFTPMLLFAGLVLMQLVFHRSAYWFVTWQKALLWTLYAILLFLVTQCFRSEALLKRFAAAASIFGFLVAILAIAQEFAGNGKYYWEVTNQAGTPFFGTYANHSHYAGLMEMLIPFPLLLALARLVPASLRILYAFAAVIMSSTIFLSQSRGGIIAFAAEIGVLTILAARGHRRRRQVAAFALFAALLFVCLMLVRPVGLWGRFVQLGEPMDAAHNPNRVTILKDSLKIIRERPLLGWGFGTFPVVYPSYRSFYSDLLVNAAHDDFVEITVETGLLGLAVALAFIYLLYRTAIRQVRHWMHDVSGATALAALAGCTGLLVHSFSDFNLQVPANAALFFSLAALATTARSAGDRSLPLIDWKSRSPRNARSDSVLRWR